MRDRPVRFPHSAILRLLLVLPLLLALTGGAEAKKKPPRIPWTGPVPKADCGPSDRTETGLQGQTTVAERMSGASLQAYNCNLELVGQFTGEGAQWQHAWFDDCAYYGTNNAPQQQPPGTVVIDASDPRHPRASAYLTDPAILEPWESLKVNKKRKLLAGVQADDGRGHEPGFVVYDVSDCAHPVLKASAILSVDVHGHAGDFAPDGRTYYGTGAHSAETGRSIYPINLTDVSDPKAIMVWTPPTSIVPHDVSINDDGTRLYIAASGNAPPTRPGPNGLMIVDVSDIQFRRPNPEFRILGTIFWPDGGVAQVPTPIRIKGRPYILFADELGPGRIGRPAQVSAACAQGLPPFGFARLIDISDERNPTEVAKLMLEVHDPANCSAVINDSANPIFWYDSHYCTVDNPRNARLAACAYFQSGVRVFDIRDPYRPKEVAYYKPGAVGSASRPGSSLAQSVPGYRDHDWSSSNSRFVKVRGERYLWITSQDNGFQVLRFTRDVLRR